MSRTAANDRLERLRNLLACPRCRHDVTLEPEQARCTGCGARYPRRNDKLYFVEPPQRDDDLDQVKGWIKRRLGRCYYAIGVTVFAPTFPFSFSRALKKYVDLDAAVVLDIGCGNHRFDARIIGAELFDYEAVDVVCDLNALPFRDGSLDAVVSRSVLEHLPDPLRIAGEITRTVKPDGLTAHLAPFMFPFHASPNDFFRFTHEGIRKLFPEWTLVEQFNATGPFTLWVATTVELLATLFGIFGARVRSVAYLLFCGLLFPLKFLDWPLIRRPAILPLAPTIFSVFRKRGATAA